MNCELSSMNCELSSMNYQLRVALRATVQLSWIGAELSWIELSSVESPTTSNLLSVYLRATVLVHHVLQLLTCLCCYNIIITGPIDIMCSCLYAGLHKVLWESCVCGSSCIHISLGPLLLVLYQHSWEWYQRKKCDLSNWTVPKLESF